MSGRNHHAGKFQGSHMAKVAFLGLGVMGFPMAGHLVVKGGHEVTVFNRTPAKAKAWAEKFGGKTAATPKATAEGQDFVMACVGNDNDLRAITIGPDGAFAGMKKGATFVDHTTASAEMRKPGNWASSLSMRPYPAARPVPRTAC
jgi:3-hydroxyisobutyrate dehydrogenase